MNICDTILNFWFTYNCWSTTWILRIFVACFIFSFCGSGAQLKVHQTRVLWNPTLIVKILSFSYVRKQHIKSWAWYDWENMECNKDEAARAKEIVEIAVRAKKMTYALVAIFLMFFPLLSLTPSPFPSVAFAKSRYASLLTSHPRSLSL